MHSFLNNIAEAYVADPDLHTYTFVFPNVRSKRYFARRLTELGVDSYKAGDLCITFTEMAEKGSGLRRTSGERLLFLLYKAYRDVCDSFGSHAPKVQEFDRFRFWGQIILRDFDDVDRYLADASEVFRNAADYKKIQSFYLTDTQKEIIEAYWGDDPYWSSVPREGADADAGNPPFWNHVTRHGETEKTFTQLWAVLGAVYRRFRELLGDECYPGMAYRAVAERLRAGEELRPFNPRLFVFIGFNRLSTAEHVIFEELLRRGKAHFYWDYDPSLMNHLGANIASRFIARYKEHFSACKAGVRPPVRPEHHRVDVIGVSSAVGQAKVAAEALSREESAVVLPSEDMLLPMVASIPEKFGQINVTMGYPMRFSALSQLFSLLVNLQLHSTLKDSTAIFFRDDVRALITNPLTQSVLGAECRFVESYMRKANLYNLPADRITDGFGALRVFLQPLAPDSDMRQMAAYVTSVLDVLSSSGLICGIDAKCAEVISRMVEQIVALSEECGVTMNRHTFFLLIERTLFQRTLPLEGETFDALQVMGVLETRAMGFTHVVMLSMTDAVFPGRDTSRSFIPETLRRAYGLPTRDHFDVDAAYHFYHILSAAEHLTLIYDARTGGLASGEMSRFIFQLRYLNFPSVELHMHMASFSGELPDSSPAPLIARNLSMPKNERIMGKLRRYSDPAQCAVFSLSASSLETYLRCPTAFFLERIENIRPPEDTKESMSAADYGNVIHETADRVYSRLKTVNGGLITPQMLRTLLDEGPDGLLEQELNRAINLCLNHFPAQVDGADNPALFTTEIEGEAIVYRPAFLKVLRNLFEADCAAAPFEIVATELTDTFPWAVTPDLTVNFTMKIDRIDRITCNGRSLLRLVDYKTGKDIPEFSTPASLLAKGDPNHAHAVFQLFTYCAAYCRRHSLDPAGVRPQIFTLRNPSEQTFPLIRHAGAKCDVESYAQVCEEFEEELRRMFTELFDPEGSITSAENEKCCDYCNFYSFCHPAPHPPKYS